MTSDGIALFYHAAAPRPDRSLRTLRRTRMKLRHAAASPFVRKVMVAAHELALAGRIELEPTNISPIRANATLARENPLMKVPSFVTDDGQVLFDSPVIC